MLEFNGDTPSLAIETSDISATWAKDRFGDKFQTGGLFSSSVEKPQEKSQSNYYRRMMLT
jgi:glutathionylspermidine synthase